METLAERMRQAQSQRRTRKESILSELNVDEQTIIKSILGRYPNLSQTEVETRWTDIIDTEKKSEKCKDCTGLKDCKQSNPGYVYVVDTDAPYVTTVVKQCKHERQRVEQARISRMLSSSGVPRLYSGLTFEDYTETPENKKAVEAAHWILNSDKKESIYLYGSKGTGKTMLASIITNELIRHGKPVLFSSVPELMADIRASFKTDNTADVIDSIKQAAVLILDDLGAERATEWVGEQIFSIINSRYENNMQTIITSNFTPDELILHFADKTQGERIISRIYGMCVRVNISGKDWRMQR